MPVDAKKNKVMLRRFRNNTHAGAPGELIKFLSDQRRSSSNSNRDFTLSHSGSPSQRIVSESSSHGCTIRCFSLAVGPPISLWLTRAVRHERIRPPQRLHALQ